MGSNSNHEILERIRSALEAASRVLGRFTAGAIEAEYKAGHDPVTEADRCVDTILRKDLLRNGEGWLSEESVDDLARLEASRVWVVDPLDGTREFVAGIPEFCVSIAMVQDGRPVAGGVCNPATNEIFLGSIDSGVSYQGKPAQVSRRASLSGASVLASRSEIKRGEWKQFDNAPFTIRPMGSVAYKLALVSAGLADATFTLLRSTNGMSRRGPLWWKAPEDSCVHWRTLCYAATINHRLFPVFLRADPTWTKNCLRSSTTTCQPPHADNSASSP